MNGVGVECVVVNSLTQYAYKNVTTTGFVRSRNTAAAVPRAGEHYIIIIIIIIIIVHSLCASMEFFCFYCIIITIIQYIT
jgi:uncharacterized protein YqhQ